MKRERFEQRLLRIFEDAGYSPSQIMSVTPEEMVEIPGITVPNIRAVLAVQNRVLDETYGSHKKVVSARLLSDIQKTWSQGKESELAERLEQIGSTVIPLRADLPEKCFVYVESTNEIGIVTKGEKGYIPLGQKPEGVSVREGAALLNETQGVTKAQAEAMKAGSLFGWDTPAADPKNYDDTGKPLRPKHRERGEAR